MNILFLTILLCLLSSLHLAVAASPPAFASINIATPFGPTPFHFYTLANDQPPFGIVLSWRPSRAPTWLRPVSPESITNRSTQAITHFRALPAEAPASRYTTFGPESDTANTSSTTTIADDTRLTIRQYQTSNSTASWTRGLPATPLLNQEAEWAAQIINGTAAQGYLDIEEAWDLCYTDANRRLVRCTGTAMVQRDLWYGGDA
ncbi:MAG: hypothetical protein Q9222_001765 [Ikaeria aurantiellina]